MYMHTISSLLMLLLFKNHSVVLFIPFPRFFCFTSLCMTLHDSTTGELVSFCRLHTHCSKKVHHASIPMTNIVALKLELL